MSRKLHTTTMGSLLFLLPLLFVALPEIAAGQRSNTNFICVVQPTSSPETPPLPSLPNQFSTRVEENRENEGYTVNVVEYYDGTNNRGRVDFSGARHRHGGDVGPVRLIFLYTEKQWLSMNATHCTAHNLNNNARFMPFRGTFDAQGHGHIAGVADVLHFGKKFNETYMGQDTVRGIRANHWRTCMKTQGGNFSLDWYFSVANSSQEPPGHPTPLRLVIEGVYKWSRNGTVRATGHWSRNGTVRATGHYFKSSHEFVFFTPGPVDNSVFQIPHGMFCDGSSVTRDFPPVPDQFSSHMQLFDAVKKTIFNFQVHYSTLC